MYTRAPDLIRCDVADTAPDVRVGIDRADPRTGTRVLRPGKRLDDGAVRREAILARVGDVMDYPWGQEVATVEALSDLVYLDSLRGLALVAKHPRARRVDVDKPGTYREVGAITGARYDAAEKAVIIEVAIRDPAAERAVKSGQTGVSEGYTVTRMDATAQPARQLGRRPNHVALTLDDNPRQPRAHLRNDQETPMELAAILALCSAFGLRTDTAEHLRADLEKKDAARADADREKQRADAAETRADAAEKKTEALAPLFEVLDPTRTDADLPAQLDALVADRAAKLTQIREDAARLNVDLPAELTTYEAIVQHVAAKLGAPERCDASAAEWFVAGRLAGGAAKRFADGAGPRTDSTATDPHRF